MFLAKKNSSGVDSQRTRALQSVCQIINKLKVFRCSRAQMPILKTISTGRRSTEAKRSLSPLKNDFLGG